MADPSKYKKLTPIDHVLIRPEMYVGSVETTPTPMYIYDASVGKMKWETVHLNNGLLKIVDEILLNASDNINNRSGRMTYIAITITPEGDITVENDGAGIPIVKHKENKLYIPEMVFGHLLTSSNYDNDQESTAAGRHGYGAKLTNILSKKFSVTCRTRGKMFQMSWMDHMRKATAPRVATVDTKLHNVTKVRFMPDYERFGFRDKKISNDMKLVLQKRIMDLAAMFPKLKILLNGHSIGFNSFADYAALYVNDPPSEALASSAGALPPPFVYESKNGQISFVPNLVPGVRRTFGVVNGVVTYNGGTHCTAATELLMSALDTLAKDLRKNDKTIDVTRVARHFTVLIFLIQVQPKFDSQNKARLVSTATMPRVPKPDLVKYLGSMPFLDDHVSTLSGQLTQELNKELLGVAGRRLTSKSLISSITKLVDATSTRTDGKNVRTLIVTEGDSAKALALNSLSSEQKKYCGVFPLRGKLLNVRNRNLKRLKNCKELQELFCSLGLVIGEMYKDAKSLRYQRLLIMTDQDADGSHIKGLIINAFESLWPTLLIGSPGFLSIFSTPIVKIRTTGRDKQMLSFYSFKEYNKWRLTNKNVNYTAKYYKGLGTSTTVEGKEYFTDMEKHTMRVIVERSDKRLLDSVFDSQEVEWRKDWMTKANAFTGEVDIDRSKKSLTISDFVYKEMVHFALAGNARALAHSVDGLKPSQRKIIWAMLRRSGSDSAKVAQLSGYISEVSSFHHGEVSLQETMIKMAQNFTGGNNINLLVPEGQFGSRQQLGNDHAAARYIFTKLSRFARVLYPSEDDALLEYVLEEGHNVEPTHYVPIIPLLLCNGSVGIGFGFASNIPPFHPLDVSAAVRSMIQGEAAQKVMRRLVPWAVGFQGSIRRGEDGSFVAVGRYNAFGGGRFHITELPWMVSIEAFRAHVSSLASADVVQKIADYSGANHVDIDLVLTEGVMTTYAEAETDLFLQQKIHVNGTTFSPNGTLTPLEGDLSPILQWHYDRRLDLYKKRRQRNLQMLEAELAKEQSTLAFMTKFRAGEVDLTNATDESLEKMCQKMGLVRVDDCFDYVLKKPITFYTRSSLEKLEQRIADTKEKIQALKATTAVELWLKELDAFDRLFEEYEKLLVHSIAKELRSNIGLHESQPMDLRQPKLLLEEPRTTARGLPMRVRSHAYQPPPKSKRAGGGGGSAAAAAAATAASAGALKSKGTRQVSAAAAGSRGSVKKMLVNAVTTRLTSLLPRLLFL